MKKIILDVDTGEDDALAVLLAIQDNLLLEYVVTSYGNTSLENATKNTSAMISLAKNPHVKVIRGSKSTLQSHPHQKENVSAGDFVGKNGLCNVTIPECIYDNILSPTENEFVDFLFNKITELKKVDYIITGPCTNFARLLRKYKKELFEYVENVYIMGGAVYTPGNSGPVNPATQKQYAEFNFYCDAQAAKEVLNSGLPIHLISWDITSTVTIPYQSIDKMKSDTNVGNFVIDLMKCFFKYYGLSHDRNFELNDPLTVVAQQGYGQYKKLYIDVITEGEQYGQTVESEKGSLVQYYSISDDEKRQYTNKILDSLDITFE